MDKQKQIEEMKNHINNASDLYHKTGESDITKAIAEELIKYYQPKLPEGSVVVGKEEREELHDTIRGALERVEKWRKLCDIKTKEIEAERKQAVKEFAERLKRRIYSGFYSWQSSMTYEKFCKVEREALLIDEIAKEMGVEL